MDQTSVEFRVIKVDVSSIFIDHRCWWDIPKPKSLQHFKSDAVLKSDE